MGILLIQTNMTNNTLTLENQHEPKSSENHVTQPKKKDHVTSIALLTLVLWCVLDVFFLPA